LVRRRRVCYASCLDVVGVEWVAWVVSVAVLAPMMRRYSRLNFDYRARVYEVRNTNTAAYALTARLMRLLAEA